MKSWVRAVLFDSADIRPIQQRVIMMRDRRFEHQPIHLMLSSCLFLLYGNSGTDINEKNAKWCAMY